MGHRVRAAERERPAAVGCGDAGAGDGRREHVAGHDARDADRGADVVGRGCGARRQRAVRHHGALAGHVGHGGARRLHRDGVEPDPGGVVDARPRDAEILAMCRAVAAGNHAGGLAVRRHPDERRAVVGRHAAFVDGLVERPRRAQARVVFLRVADDVEDAVLGVEHDARRVERVGAGIQRGGRADGDHLVGNADRHLVDAVLRVRVGVRRQDVEDVVGRVVEAVGRRVVGDAVQHVAAVIVRAEGAVRVERLREQDLYGPGDKVHRDELVHGRVAVRGTAIHGDALAVAHEGKPVRQIEREGARAVQHDGAARRRLVGHQVRRPAGLVHIVEAALRQDRSAYRTSGVRRCPGRSPA